MNSVPVPEIIELHSNDTKVSTILQFISKYGKWDTEHEHPNNKEYIEKIEDIIGTCVDSEYINIQIEFIYNIFTHTKLFTHKMKLSNGIFSCTYYEASGDGGDDSEDYEDTYTGYLTDFETSDSYTTGKLFNELQLQQTYTNEKILIESIMKWNKNNPSIIPLHDEQCIEELLDECEEICDFDNFCLGTFMCTFYSEWLIKAREFMESKKLNDFINKDIEIFNLTSEPIYSMPVETLQERIDKLRVEYS